MASHSDWWTAPDAVTVRRSCSAILIATTDITSGDINREYYRSKQEEQTWKTERDPIANFGKWLVEQKLADVAALDRLRAELESEMKKAVDFAVAAPYPTVDEVDEDVYA